MTTLINVFSTLVQSSSQLPSTAINDSEAAALVFSMFGFVWVYVCAIFVFVYGFLFLLGYLVYKDAEKNNIDNPLLWGLITVIFGFLGILLYFLVAKNQKR